MACLAISLTSKFLNLLLTCANAFLSQLLIQEFGDAKSRVEADGETIAVSLQMHCLT